jgi:hypothetical protein
MHITRTAEHEQAYASLIAAITRREELPPWTRPRSPAWSKRHAHGRRPAKLSIRFGD